jgi:hypothetical protein
MDAIASRIEHIQTSCCRNKNKLRHSRRVTVAMQLPPECKNKGRMFLAFAAFAMQVNVTSLCEHSLRQKYMALLTLLRMRGLES